MAKKIKVSHSFLNKKGEFKTVKFTIDELLYNDILKLPNEEKNYWLEYYYHEYCKECNYERKEFRNREKFISADQVEVEDEDGMLSAKDKLSQIADESYNEQTIINKLIVNEMLELLDDVERFVIVHVTMKGYSIISVANKLGIAESTVRKKIKLALEKIRNNYPM